MASLRSDKVGYDGTPEPYKLVHDHKRDTDYRAKYANGVIIRGEGSKPNARAMQPAKAPVKIPERKPHKHKQRPSYAIKDKQALLSDTSDDEPRESPDDIAAGIDIAYSYDSDRGPLDGRDIFSMAMNQAVERFETKETEKLVKDEYDVVRNDDIEEEEDEFRYIVDGEFEML